MGVRPYLRPLAEVMDEFPHFAVALVEENNARLFTIGLGDIQEYRRPRVGMVDAIRRMMRSEHLSKLILAGPPELTTKLRSIIERRLGSALIATTDIAFNAEPAEILQRTMPLGEQLQGKEESQIVRDLTVEPPQGSWTVTGLGATLDLLNQGRLWQLVYAEGLRGRAHECRQCAAIFGIDSMHSGCHWFSSNDGFRLAWRLDREKWPMRKLSFSRFAKVTEHPWRSEQSHVNVAQTKYGISGR